jgi:hypothetical protein
MVDTYETGREITPKALYLKISYFSILLGTFSYHSEQSYFRDLDERILIILRRALKFKAS